MSQHKQTHNFIYYKSTDKSESKCLVPNCKEPAENKVLLDPRNSKERGVMCFQHAKEHNKTVDYFKNMNFKEIESEIKSDIVWRLPTWPLRGGYKRFFIDHGLFNLFQKDSSQSIQEERSPLFPSQIEEAGKIIGVSLPISLLELKRVYKAKVKKHHPDLNRDKKGAEEELKKINIAYKTLCTYLNNA